jgi:hypothetical protein
MGHHGDGLAIFASSHTIFSSWRDCFDI